MLALPALSLNGDKVLSLPLATITSYENLLAAADFDASALGELFLETIGSTVEGKIDVGPVAKLWVDVKVSQHANASTLLADALWLAGSQVSLSRHRSSHRPRRGWGQRFSKSRSRRFPRHVRL